MSKNTKIDNLRDSMTKLDEVLIDKQHAIDQRLAEWRDARAHLLDLEREFSNAVRERSRTNAARNAVASDLAKLLTSEYGFNVSVSTSHVNMSEDPRDYTGEKDSWNSSGCEWQSSAVC